MKRHMGFVVTGIALAILVGFASQSDARVNINIGIGIPAYNFGAPPSLVVIPGTYAYFVPGVDLDILFYQGFWYRPYEGRWYRARGYNGPWVYISAGRVPRVLIGLPHDYRRLYGGHRHIEYGDFNRNWRRWERERYWDRDERWREGRHERREDRRERRRDYRHGY
jgi:hypothetical protein